jgi:hypothetical protein
MTPDEFKVFVEELKNLPPMGPTSVQNDVAFWREMDAMQTTQQQRCTKPAGHLGFHKFTEY